MTGRHQVATVTLNPTIDVGLVVEVLTPDHKMRASAARREPGGGGVNVARSLHRLGTDCVATLTAGGATGAELVERLREEGVATNVLPIAGDTRESVSLTEASTGAQFRVVVEGPPLSADARDQDALGEDVLDQVVDAVAGSEIVVLSGALNPGLSVDTYRRLAERMPDTMVVVDCAPPALNAVIEGAAALVKPSRRELSILVGRDLPTREHVVEAAVEALGRGAVGAMVVSLGPDGAVLVEHSHEPRWFAAPAIPDVVSTVGCGDAMVAGMVRALALGRPLEVAVGFGVATGTAAATTPGTELFDPELAAALAARMTPPVTV